MRDEDKDNEAELKEYEEFAECEEDELEVKGDEMECLLCCFGEVEQDGGFSNGTDILSKEDELFWERADTNEETLGDRCLLVQTL